MAAALGLSAAVWVLPGFFKAEMPSEKGGTQLPDVVDFNFHVKPIISDRCFKCHGPDESKQEASLGLDNEAGWFQALQEHPDRFVVVPGDLAASELYQRLVSHDPDLLMPPPESNLSLTPHEIAVIGRWIEQGAVYKRHWSLLPPERPVVPTVRDKDWPRNEIDHFLLHRMEREGLRPNEEADKPRLLRRVSYDLTGLPPSAALLEAFLSDDSPEAYEKAVDHLLALPSYGEHQAVPWLDLARYADSHGYQDDSYRSMWPWRDWVIDAFNRNLPYDTFVTWQLAGDLLPDATPEQRLATGFCRNHKITQEGGVIEEEYRVEYIADKTNLYGLAFLGMTFECARCHTHKYDPITQAEYFKTYAFFNQSAERGFYGDVSTGSVAELPVLIPTRGELDSLLTFIQERPGDTVVSMVMQDLPAPRKTFVLQRGMYDQPKEEVGFGTPEAILPFDTTLPGNRLGLARWTFHPENPLTARVAVNRIWQQFFGTGLVKSADNFGNQGELPSHPELLDWLATDFRDGGWDMKRLVRQIVCSAAYRQSAVVSSEKLEADPENRLLARGPRFRMTPEMIRDTWLATSGLLDTTIGGPPVRPYQPAGLWEETNAGEGRGTLTRYVQDTGSLVYRRTMYTIFKRTLPHPFLTTFDASYRDVCAIRRQRTNTPLQALNLMNDPTQLDAASYLAAQLVLLHAADAETLVREAFRRVTGHAPSDREARILRTYFDARTEYLHAREDLVAQLRRIPAGHAEDSVYHAVPALALAEVVSMVYNTDEVLNK